MILFYRYYEEIGMPKKKLLDIVREKIRLRHYSLKTEKAYIGWIKRYILFHDKKHPVEMGKKEIESFLTWLAVERNVSPSTQNQAFNALLFLYEQVLEIPLKNENIQVLRIMVLGGDRLPFEER